MESLLLVIHLLIAIAIIAVIMIQPAESGGFMGNSSMGNAMAPRRRGDVLTRATTTLAGCFFVTSLLLALLASHRPADKSILDIETTDKPVVSDSVETPPALEPVAKDTAEEKPSKIKPVVKEKIPKAPVAK